MRSQILINTIGCHAAGEVGEVILSGVQNPIGKTIAEKSKFLMDHPDLRNLLLLEPRGGVYKHFNLILPPINKKADFGWIIMEPMFNPPMSGSNAICTTTVIFETGMKSMEEPFSDLILESPGGLIKTRAYCCDGKVKKVEIENLPSFVYKKDCDLEIPDLGTFKVDIAFGGDSFVIIDAKKLGFSLIKNEAADLVKLGEKITTLANEQIGFKHPKIKDWNHISFCQFTLPIYKNEKGYTEGKNTVVIKPGKLDRSPCGTGCSARMALLVENGILKKSDIFIGKSILDTQFACKVDDIQTKANKNYIIPKISGSAWITGHHSYFVDHSDPFKQGYKLSDTWPSF